MHSIALIHAWVIFVEFMIKNLLALNLLVYQHLDNKVFQEPQILQRF